ncbi:MAG: right-handed parallel beta-helix repeat-containing protein [Planctomycetota bacterium]
MHHIVRMIIGLCCLACLPSLAAGHRVDTVPTLVAAAGAAEPGDVIELAAGEYVLPKPLQLKSGVSLRGAGIDKTILTNAEAWRVGYDGLPDKEVDHRSVRRDAYLIDLGDNAEDVTIANLTLKGSELHGAIYGNASHRLVLHDLKIEYFLWSGVRLFRWQDGKIHDCLFIDAGGQAKGNKGITGGGIFLTWARGCEIYNNRFTQTEDHLGHYYGIKGRQANDTRIHHNTIGCNFAIELPFENESGVEIDHNYLGGVVSIPKHAGGPAHKDDKPWAFHLHHNYFTTSYAVEGPRNGLLVEHNLFDFNTEKDGGSLISIFGKATAPGPIVFRHNYVSNPGRGVFWSNPIVNQLTFINNHIVTRTTTTPRKEGLFGMSKKTDFTTVRIENNLIECIDQARPLVRNDESAEAMIKNNRLTNVSDTARYANASTDEPVGPQGSNAFRVGVDGEYRVDRFTIEKFVR